MKLLNREQYILVLQIVSINKFFDRFVGDLINYTFFKLILSHRERLSHLFRWIYAVASLLAAGESIAQTGTPNFVRYTVADGLPSTEVYQLMQDHEGYIWIATDRGVARMDGNKQVITFTSLDGLYDDAIFGIHEDIYRRIWFFGLSGRLCYWKDGKINRPACNDSLVKHLKGMMVQYLTSDRKGHLYIGINRHPHILKMSDKIEALHPPAPDNAITLYNSDQTPMYYSIPKITKNTHTVNIQALEAMGNFAVQYRINPSKMAKGRIMAINSGRNGYYISMGEYLIHIDTLKQVKSYFLNAPATVSLYEDKENNVWIGTEKNGVFCFDNGDLNNTPRHFLKGYSVSSVYQDNEYGYWLTTLDGGVFYTPAMNMQSFNRQTIQSTPIENVDWDSTDLVVNTKGPVVYRVRKEGADWKISNPKSLKNNTVIYTGTNQAILYTLHNTFILERKTPIRGFIIKNRRCLYARNEHDAVLFVDSGFAELHREKLLFSGITKTDLPGGLWLSSVALSGGNTYVGSSNGLYKLDENGRSVNMGDSDPRLKVRINDLCSIGDSRMFAATLGNGVVLLENEKFFRTWVKTPSGLPSNVCNVLCRGNNNVLWVGTNAGLCRITFDEQLNPVSFRNLTTKDGLASNYIVSVAVRGNEVAIGTDQGFSIWNDKPLPIPLKPVKTSIMYVTVDNKLIEPTSGLTLERAYGLITIGYGCNQYKNAGHHLYRYRVKSGDINWEYTHSTSVNLHSLKAGKYTFEVQVQNSDASWSSIPARFSFEIPPPFWNTWTARIIMGLCILILVSGGWAVYVRRQQRRHQERLELDHFKNQALKNQMNPHFVFNSLAAIQNYLLSNDVKQSVRYLAKFGRLMRLTLDNSRKNLISLDDEISILKMYVELEKNRSMQRFDYQITIDPSLDTGQWKLPPLILQPYIENAILHGLGPKQEKGCLLIHFSERAHMLCCVIEDNGIGREESARINKPPQKQHQSNATNITEGRVRLMNNLYDARISILTEDLYKNNVPCGTRITFTIPKLNFKGS